MAKRMRKQMKVRPAVVESAEAVPVRPAVEVVEDAHAVAYRALAARQKAARLEERAVRLGRESGRSWDVLGRWLEMPGETLRRRYGEQLERGAE